MSDRQHILAAAAEILERDDVTLVGSVDTFAIETVDGVLELTPETQAAIVARADELGTPSLASVQDSFRRMVDADAEATRNLHITPGAGQAMTYLAKAQEAAAFLAAQDPEPGDYPLLSAEIGITAPDIAGVAAIVAASHAAWLQLGAAIEAVRLGAKAAITAAEDAGTVQAVYDGVAWPG